MEKIPEKAILGFVSISYPNYEFNIDVDSYGEHYLILVVDVAKTDKNSSQFDKKYRDFLYPDLEGMNAFLYRPIDKIKNITVDVENFFNISLNPSFRFKNYEYLDDIGKKIEKTLDLIGENEINFRFQAFGDNPIVSALFYNVPKKYVQQNNNVFLKVIDQIEKKSNLIIYKNYKTSWSASKK